MPVGALFEVGGFTEAHYEAVLVQVGEEPPEGCLVHIAGATDSGWRVIEVWDTEESQRRFHESRLNPAFDAAGTQRVGPPTFFPVHNVLPPAEALASLAAGS
jgi:hypothetical protein